MSATKNILSSQRIYIAGHRGMVGSALVRALRTQGCKNLVLRTRQELDLCDSVAVRSFFEKEKPEIVVNAAARVGGIHANSTYPAEFIHDSKSYYTSVFHCATATSSARLSDLECCSTLLNR